MYKSREICTGCETTTELKDKLHKSNMENYSNKLDITSLHAKVSRRNMQIKDLKAKLEEEAVYTKWDIDGLLKELNIYRARQGFKPYPITD